ncbi:acyl-CoA thioesterase [Bacillus rubiinfantis]|uniref:acyl-CoA thioesterase n=1 Tax=Bacillus rubiinfantis TaxID=1499680 RepID=UPI0005A6D840|nr:thioesterase family protein [Bacillus rubiinfantis]
MEHEIQVIARFSETDALGHINNTSYFIYLEEARIRFLEMLGFDLNGQNFSFILASAKCDYISQGFFNQQLRITTYVTKIGTKSFQLEHDIINKDTNQLIAHGQVVMVYFDFEKQQSKPLPELMKQGLNTYLVHL